MLFQHGPQHKGDFPGDNFLIYIDTAEFSQTRIAIFDTCPVHIHKLWNQLVHQGHLNKKNEYDELVLKKKVRLSTQIVPKWIVYAYVALMHEHSHCCVPANSRKDSWYWVTSNVINTICANCRITIELPTNRTSSAKKNGAAVGLKTEGVQPCGRVPPPGSEHRWWWLFTPWCCGGKWLDF